MQIQSMQKHIVTNDNKEAVWVGSIYDSGNKDTREYKGVAITRGFRVSDESFSPPELLCIVDKDKIPDFFERLFSCIDDEVIKNEVRNKLL